MQTLDFSALEHNALYYKKLLGNSKLCAVVKNDAYGHGAVHVARYLDGIVDFFAVGNVDEAARIDFVSRDVLLLLPQPRVATDEAVRRGFVLSVDSLQTLQTVIDSSNRLAIPARIHIKIDSGMTRLGFRYDELTGVILRVQRCPRLAVEGVYSHFYGETVASCDKQLNAFLPCAEVLEKAFCKTLVKHIANSRGALLSSKYRLDMARIGLGLYGYGNSDCIPVKTVTANVIAVKDVEAGEAVGYGAKYVAQRRRRIAVVDVGYARGFSRALVGVQIKINGRLCSVVAVCMAMIMVDVTDVENVCVGNVATLIGDGVDASNGLVSVYESLCNLR